MLGTVSSRPKLLAVGRWFPPGTPVSSTRKLISSSSFHRLDMTLAVAEALPPIHQTKSTPKQGLQTMLAYLHHVFRTCFCTDAIGGSWKRKLLEKKNRQVSATRHSFEISSPLLCHPTTADPREFCRAVSVEW